MLVKLIYINLKQIHCEFSTESLYSTISETEWEYVDEKTYYYLHAAIQHKNLSLRDKQIVLLTKPTLDELSALKTVKEYYDYLNMEEKKREEQNKKLKEDREKKKLLREKKQLEKLKSKIAELEKQG